MWSLQKKEEKTWASSFYQRRVRPRQRCFRLCAPSGLNGCEHRTMWLLELSSERAEGEPPRGTRWDKHQGSCHVLPRGWAGRAQQGRLVELFCQEPALKDTITRMWARRAPGCQVFLGYPMFYSVPDSHLQCHFNSSFCFIKSIHAASIEKNSNKTE